MPEITEKRRNRVFKSLHKPLTYMGIERSLFFMIAVSAVGMFNLFNSIIGAVIVFVAGFHLRPLGDELRSGFPQNYRTFREIQTAL